MPRCELAAVLGGLMLSWLAGCSRGTNEPLVLPPSPTPSPVATAPSRAFSPPARPSASPSVSFGEGYAVSCGGQPAGDRVVVLLRGKGFVAAGAQVTVQAGPLCAGSWQYTVLSIPGRGLLQVVTKGVPPGLELVTAGTDVCTAPVRVEAPAGIVAAARCNS